MRYSFVLEYVPGREMFIADFLSRSVDRHGPECRCKMMGTDIRLEDAFISMLTTVQVSDEITDRIRTEVRMDKAYENTVKGYATGFTTQKAGECGEYWSVREQLVMEDGLLYFEGRLVIPRGARPRVIEALHRGHVALATMQKRAKETAWWPAMTLDLKNKAHKCGDCQAELPMQQREPMQSFEIPAAPGLVVHADHFELSAREYLILVDGFSGWTEVFTSGSRKPAEVIRLLRSYITRHGIPRQFHSDQGSAFMSHEFRTTCQKWGIRVTEGSAKHPRGNAIAEAYVKKIKHILRTAKDEDDLAQAILAMHQTPVAPGRPSPAQLHFGRNLRDELHPTVVQTKVEWGEVREWKQAVAHERKKQFDRGTRELRELKVGELVLVRHQERWERAKVTKILARPRSYAVRVLATNRELERNRHLIREIDPESTNPALTKVNPSVLLQPRRPQLPLRLLMVPVPPVGAASTAPDPASRTPTPQPPPGQRTTPPTHRRPAPPATPDSGPPPLLSSPAAAGSAQSRRSYASAVQTPYHSDASDSSSSDRSVGSDTEYEDDDGDHQPTPPPRTPPSHITRAGRPVRQPNRYSPS